MKHIGSNFNLIHSDTYQTFKRHSRSIVFLYLISSLYFILNFNDYSPSINHLFIQYFSICVFAYLCVYSLRHKVSLQRFFITLLCCIIIEIVVFRIWNIVVYKNPLGYNPVDSVGYDEFARIFVEKKHALGDLFYYLKESGESVDDYGFLTIICITYKIFGADVGIFVLTIFNAIAWCLGCYLLYKLTALFNIEKDSRRVIALLWGSFSYCIFTAATGLKENFFCLAIIFTMYRLYKYLLCRKISYLLLFIVGAIACSLFRLALLFIFITTFIFSISLKYRIFSRHLKFWLVIGSIASLLLLPLVISYIAEMRGNMAVNQGYIDAISSGNNLVIYAGINVLSVFTGPIPNFISDLDKLNYITLWNFGTFMRFLLSGYSFYAIYCIIKYKARLYYPLIFFIVLHSIMLVVTMFAIHDRYQMVQIPFVYVLSVYGMIKLTAAKHTTRVFFNRIFLLGATVFIILFNILKY